MVSSRIGVSSSGRVLWRALALSRVLRTTSVITIATALAGTSVQAAVVNSNVLVKSKKRGVAVFVPGNDLFTLSTEDFRALDPGVSWYYDWGILELQKPDDVSIDYVPMVWGGGTGAQDYLDDFLASGKTPPFVLGLNEPNLAWEANMTPEYAATTAVQIKAICDDYGIPLVAPQVTIGTDPAASITAYDPIQNATVTYTYQETYMAAFNYYCGTATPWAQATHSYGGLGEVAWITGEMHANRPSQPVFVTEMNWSSAGSIDAAVNNAIATVDYLERTSWVGGYAWFMARITGDRKDSILAANGELTEVGKAFVRMPPHDPDLYYRIPGRLQAEKYVSMDGFDVGTSTDTSSDGLADLICYGGSPWLDYNVQVDTPGTYYVHLRVYGTGTVGIYKGATQLATVTSSSSGWTTLSTSVALTNSGAQTLRVTPVFGQRVNYIDWVTAAPSVPANPVATPGDWRVTLTWDYTLNAARYSVKRSTSSGSGYSQIGTTESESFVDRTADNGTVYYYVVTAINELGESAASAQVSAVPTPNPVLDAGFETPVTGSYVSAPSGTAWSFTGSAGVSANGSGYTWANPNAPQGTQVAYVQADGTMSQVLNHLTPGATYEVSFKAAQRQSWGGAQSWDVKIDGAVIASYSPVYSASNYTVYTAQFVATKTAQVLTFAGTTFSDNTILIDEVGVGNLSNLGFETPGVSGYVANPVNAVWTFSGSCGITANGSGYTSGNPNAPEGRSVAYLQGASTISQTLSGFQSGKLYTLRFSAAQRANWGGAQSWNVLVNGNVVASFAPAREATSYEDYVAQFTASGSTQTISFVGTGSTSTDNTILLDNIRITTTP
jgi:hypothetical protein